jgi:hypothetical protein
VVVVANRARILIASGNLTCADHSRARRVAAFRTGVHIAAGCFRADAKQRRYRARWLHLDRE